MKFLSKKTKISKAEGWKAFSAELPSSSKIKLPKFGRNESNLSKGLENMKFGVEELRRYGQAGKVKTMAYDPVQSLMAICTEYNYIVILGQARVKFTLKLQAVKAIQAMRFIKGVYLVAIDSVSTVYVISLHSKSVIHTINTRIPITAFDTDYSLEYLFLGLKDGQVKAYNIETGRDTFLSVHNQQMMDYPAAVDRHVCSIKIHPRDFGTLLISYPRETAIYNIVKDQVTHTFVYTLPRNAPGGPNSTYDYGRDGMYAPLVTESLWHPNGLHIVTIHDDNSIVFWDAKTGERILARTLFDSYVDIPGGRPCVPEKDRMTPIKKVQWICGSDAEKTSLLILGGDSYKNEGSHQLIRINYGKMISYSMNSYARMADYYSQPKQQNIFAVHADADIRDFVPLPSKSPYFEGCRDPTLIALVMSNGSVKFLNYPLGTPSYAARRFPSSISWLNPQITCSSSSYLNKTILNSIYEAFPKQICILKGGIPSKPKFRADTGSVVITGHESGFIRVWNSSEGDLDSNNVLEIDISSILQNDSQGSSVARISFAPDQMEISCSLYNGDVLLFSYQSNKYYSAHAVEGVTSKMGALSLGDNALVDIADRAPASVKIGFMPKLLVLPIDNGQVTALCNSNVGFVTIGYESGRILVIDRRGNVIIFNQVLSDKGLSIKMVPTSVEFGYGITKQGETSCSILMYVGTSIGRLITYAIVPDSRGRFSVREVSQIDSNDSAINQIIAVNSYTGRPCSPNMRLLGMKPAEIDLSFPIVISSSESDVRITKNGSKVSHKSYGSGDISSMGITGAPTSNGTISFCVVLVMGKARKVVALQLPSLSQLFSVKLPYEVDAKFASQSSVLPLGDVFLRISESEAALLNVLGMRTPIRGPETDSASDVLFLKNIMVPSRPTANKALEEIPSISYMDLYKLLSGKPKRGASTTEDGRLAWNVSPYNPANYSLLGTKKPQYYNPNALHQDLEVNKSPRSSYQPGTKDWNIKNIKKYANDTLDRGSNKVGNYMNDMNDDFDKFVSQTKKDVMKSIFKSGFD